MNEWEWQLLEDKTCAESVEIAGCKVRTGDRVVLRPRAGGDIFDLALDGKTAVVEALEQDYEGKLHIAVVLEEDPGRDLGMLRQPGHRFFFTTEEIDPCPAEASGEGKPAQTAAILIAGIGNIFLGDDGFGVEVAQRLASEELSATVRIRDFGIRGYDLAYALLDPYELVILVDACPRGEKPGTIYVIEPELNEGAESGAAIALDGHTMNPVNVLRLAKSIGTVSSRILLVGCEPQTLGGDEGHMGLSEPVSAAISEAIRVVKDLIKTSLGGDR